MTGGTMDPETPIVDLEISTRAWNVCRELRLRTVQDIKATSDHTFLRVANCGRKTLKELRTVSENLPAKFSVRLNGTFDAPIVTVYSPAYESLAEIPLAEWNELVDKIRMEVSEIGTRKL